VTAEATRRAQTNEPVKSKRVVEGMIGQENRENYPMPRVMVYRFTAYSHLKGKSIEARRMGTREGIEKIKGTIIEGSGIYIDDARLETDGMTIKDFVP